MHHTLHAMHVTATAETIVSNIGDFSIFAPFALGIAAFALFYGGVFTYYRNTDKRYRYETTTDIRIANVQAKDDHMGRKNAVESSSIQGRNSGRPRERVRRVHFQ